MGLALLVLMGELKASAPLSTFPVAVGLMRTHSHEIFPPSPPLLFFPLLLKALESEPPLTVV